ncbi:MAG: PH domain-containing protein [Gammaproteobacteria bacterium]|nr:PH domain-containing protein [Gammaproteobacteria bacterium]
MLDFSYIDQSLLPGETVVYRTHPHWIIFTPTIIWVVVMLLSLLILPDFQFGKMALFSNRPFYLIFAFIALCGATVNGVVAYIQYRTSEYGITNKRVIVKVGFIQRATLEILLPRIESIQVVQSVSGRLLDYGTIIIAGTGGSRDAFRNMPSPLKFHLIAQEQAELKSRNNNDGN